MMLEQQLAEKEGEIVCLKEHIAAAKKHSQEFYDISQSVEKQLAEVTSSYNAYKEETNSKYDLTEVKIKFQMNFLSLIHI